MDVQGRNEYLFNVTHYRIQLYHLLGTSKYMYAVCTLTQSVGHLLRWPLTHTHTCTRALWYLIQREWHHNIALVTLPNLIFFFEVNIVIKIIRIVHIYSVNMNIAMEASSVTDIALPCCSGAAWCSGAAQWCNGAAQWCSLVQWCSPVVQPSAMVQLSGAA